MSRSFVQYDMNVMVESSDLRLESRGGGDSERRGVLGIMSSNYGMVLAILQ